VVEILILRQFKNPLLVTCRTSVENVKVRSLCMCNKSKQNEKLMKASGEVVVFNLIHGKAYKAVVKARATQDQQEKLWFLRILVHVKYVCTLNKT